MARTAKQLTQTQIIEQIGALELPDLLDVAKKTSMIVSIREKEEESKMDQAKKKLELIRNGGKQ